MLPAKVVFPLTAFSTENLSVSSFLTHCTCTTYRRKRRQVLPKLCVCFQKLATKRSSSHIRSKNFEEIIHKLVKVHLRFFLQNDKLSITTYDSI